MDFHENQTIRDFKIYTRLTFDDGEPYTINKITGASGLFNLLKQYDDSTKIKAAMYDCFSDRTSGNFHRSWVMYYVSNLLQSRWEGAEPIIMQHPLAAAIYALKIIRGRWREAEPYIMKNDEAIMTYSMYVIKDRWPEAEPYVLRRASSAFEYAEHVVKGRWPEAEPIIMKNAGYAFYYSRDIIKGPWPEAEPYIMESAGHYSARYRKEIILGYSALNDESSL